MKKEMRELQQLKGIGKVLSQRLVERFINTRPMDLNQDLFEFVFPPEADWFNIDLFEVTINTVH